MAKKTRAAEYLSGSDENNEPTFNSAHNQQVAVSRREAFMETLSEEQKKALLELLKGMRDNVGWKSAGRILMTGKAER